MLGKQGAPSALRSVPEGIAVPQGVTEILKHGFLLLHTLARNITPLLGTCLVLHTLARNIHMSYALSMPVAVCLHFPQLLPLTVPGIWQLSALVNTLVPLLLNPLRLHTFSRYQLPLQHKCQTGNPSTATCLAAPNSTACWSHRMPKPHFQRHIWYKQ